MRVGIHSLAYGANVTKGKIRHTMSRAEPDHGSHGRYSVLSTTQYSVANIHPARYDRTAASAGLIGNRYRI